MLDIDTGENVDALYKMTEMQGTKKVIRFKSTNIQSALGYLQWHVRKYRKGLLLEISKIKKVYDWRTKSVHYVFE